MLRAVSISFLVLSAVSFVVTGADILRNRQNMAVMNFVWPITALYFGPFALPIYFRFGREKTREDKRSKPFWQAVWVGVTHCGAGCTLGDFAAEWIAYFIGFNIFESKLFGSFVLDFVFAYVLGIVFQYFSIAPMRNLSGWPGIKAAIKADTISLIAFEAGMFVFMAYTHHTFMLEPTDPRYWFLMQIAMIIGFATSYPANWWLIRNKWKEAM